MVAQLDRRIVRAAPGRAASRLVGYSMFEGRPATTRGQWFNPVVRANLGLGARLGWGRTVREPVFVVGIGRSGTTLLGQILAVHPDVGYLNEPKAIWHQINETDDVIGSYSATPGRLLLTADDVDEHTRTRAQRIYGWYLAASGSRRVVDKYPELAYRPDYVRALFPDARFVAILRHPWDVVGSIKIWNERNTDGDANWWGVNDRKWTTLWAEMVVDNDEHRWIADLVDPDTASDQVRSAVEWYVGSTAASRLDAHHLLYDDLLNEPRPTLTGVLEACDLTADDRVLDLGADMVHTLRPHLSAPDAVPPELVARCDELYERIRSLCGS